MRAIDFLHPARAVAILAAALACASAARAGDEPPSASSPESAEASAPFRLSGEFDVSQSYVGSAEVRRKGRSDSLDEYNSEVGFVLTPRIAPGFLRIGAEWTRYSFGLGDDGARLPDTLQSVNLVLGLDKTFSDSILVRVEAHPGFYGTSFDRIDGGQFRVPFIIGGTYIYSPDLQIIAGLIVDVDQKYPVLPGAGLRWKFAPGWVFNGVLPAPRLEYSPGRATTLFAGAELKDETFRTAGGTRASRLDRRLNRALVNFSELRVGGGVVQKVSGSVAFTAEGGCQPYREFDYQRADVRYHADGLAPYGQIALHAAF